MENQLSKKRGLKRHIILAIFTFLRIFFLLIYFLKNNPNQNLKKLEKEY